MLRQITRIFVDLATPAFPAVVHAKQDDGGTRFIYATLMENGVEYVPPAGAIGIARIRKPDGKACVYDSNDQDLAAVVIDGSTVQVELVTQALTAAGNGIAEVGLYDADGNRLTSFNFRLEIEASAVADAEFISTDFINVLSAKIGEVAALVQSIQDLTVSAVTLPAGSDAKVEKTVINGILNFEFNIPEGKTGPEGPKGPPGEDANLSAGSVTTNIIADGAVTAEKLADGAVTPESIGAAKRSTIENATLNASGWSGTNYTLAVGGATASNIIELDKSPSITADQLEALQGANIVGTVQTNGSITLKAFGVVPKINIPIIVIVRGDL